MAESPVIEIVTAIADAEGVDPDDLDLVLHEHIDTDALEALANHDGESWTVSFEVPDYEVTVSSDEGVAVEDVRQTA